MKKQWMFIALVAALAAGCNQAGTNVTPDDQTTASAARATAVDGFGKGTVITQDKLPQAVLNYLSTTYAGYAFVQGVQGTDRAGATFYAVVIEQGGVRYHLHFDANGTLLPGRGHKGGPGPREANETTIAQDKLPQTILDYLNTTYAGYAFAGAEQGADSSGVVLYYEVEITQNSKTIRLNFDATGKLLERPKGRPGGPGKPPMATSVTQDKLSQATLDYLNTNYAGYTFVRAEQATTRDGATLYAVAITQTGTTYFLLFDADGKFISTRKHRK
ncbi:PepSY-like domain-containing protein [Spirosoma fluminis]